MRHLKKLENEIKNNINLEMNLPLAMNEMASAYYSYAGNNFIMHYYDFFEGMVDENITLDEEADQLLKLINQLVEENLLQEFDGDKREKSLKLLHGIREEIMKRMKVLTAYTDLFTLYEYVLNRLELKYEDSMQEIETDNDAVVKEILTYIFSKEDNVIINERIKQMLSQMPVRMTKQKFFDLLKNALMIYEGSERESLNSFIYMLRSAAGLEKPEGTDAYFPELMNCNERLKKLYTGVEDETEYQELKELFTNSVSTLVETTDVYYKLQQITNYLYTMVLNIPYADMESVQEINVLEDIVSAVNKGWKEEAFHSVPEEIVALFEQTEGKLEQESMDIGKLEGILEEITNRHKSLLNSFMLTSIYECQVLSSKLTSNSVFIELNNEEKEQEDEKKKILTKVEIESVFDAICREMSARIELQGKMFNRAMIATVLKELPVFFANRTEVMDYIKNSLAGCRDSAEKAMSIQLMRELMEDA